MSETPPDVDNPGYVKPGTGQTEKGEDRNETVAPDGSTVLPADHEVSEAEQQRRWENQPQPEGGQNADITPDEPKG